MCAREQEAHDAEATRDAVPGKIRQKPMAQNSHASRALPTLSRLSSPSCFADDPRVLVPCKDETKRDGCGQELRASNCSRDVIWLIRVVVHVWQAPNKTQRA